MKCFESSIFLRYIKKIGQVYLAIEEKIGSVYLSSFTHRLIAKIAKSIKIGFKFSIIGRLTEINKDASRNFFQTSKVTKILLNWVNNLKNGTIKLSVTSNYVTSTKTLRQTFFLSPLKVGGIIVITTIMVNLTLLIILQKQITLWGWWMRGLLLLIGISGLFCNADWPTIRSNSLILRKIQTD